MSAATHGGPARPTSAAAIRRDLVRQLESMGAELDAKAELTAAEVHEFRKRLKRARAVLALLRPALGDADRSRRCDRSLRDAGRRLAAERDATVVVATYASMRSRLGLRGAGKVPGPIAQARVALRPVRVRLDAAARELRGTVLRGRGWAPLGEGVRAVYRRGRRRRPRGSGRAAGEALHAWRRHAKRWWHVLEVFEVVAPARLGAAIADLRKLTELLGHEHDLAVLAERLASRTHRDDSGMLRAIDERREQLARRATRLGRRLFADRPREVERGLRVDWERWRAATAPRISAEPTRPGRAGGRGRGSPQAR